MNVRGFVRRATLATAVLAASLWVVPSAFARSHVSVGVGISVPGVSIGVGNCWRCGYWGPPAPVYYAPAYPPPVYYSAPAAVYYTPPPVYYGYGYYAPRYHHYYRGYDHRRGGYPHRGGYHHRGH